MVVAALWIYIYVPQPVRAETGPAMTRLIMSWTHVLLQCWYVYKNYTIPFFSFSLFCFVSSLILSPLPLFPLNSTPQLLYRVCQGKVLFIFGADTSRTDHDREE